MPKSIKLTAPDEIAGTPFEKDYLETVQQFIKEQTVLTFSIFNSPFSIFYRGATSKVSLW
jgi:hypothetical protein